MKITRHEFERSLFYIGPGLDVEPLFRFTHITDTFIYVNVFLGADLIRRWYEAAFHRWGFRIVDRTELDGLHENGFFEDAAAGPIEAAIPDFLQGNEIQDYSRTFAPAKEQPTFALRYQLRHERLGRDIVFIFMTAEGLAAYQALSHHGRFAPRILCTVQTGLLEKPDNPLERYLAAAGRRHPVLWVRGFAPTMHAEEERLQVTEPAGVFNIPVLDFNGSWISGEWYGTGWRNGDIRFCKGFTSAQSADWLASRTLRPEFVNGRHRILDGDILNAYAGFGESDTLLVSRRCRFGLRRDRYRIIYWEDFTRVGPDDRNRYADEQVGALDAMLRRFPMFEGRTLHILPHCREDQCELYVRSLHSLPNPTVTYIRRPYDMLDLKNAYAD